MGIFDWFTARSRQTAAEAVPGPQAPSPLQEKGIEVAGLNFKSAVDAHMKWKIRLDAYISGTSSEELKVDVVCRDDQCPLGKWIYGRGGGEFGYSETFFDMKAHHAHFHRCAGEVLATAQAGDTEKARRLLNHGDYVRASEKVKKLLARLFVLVSDGKTAIDAHIKWKERLQDHIQGSSSEDLKVEVISRDDLCALGIWLTSEGKAHYGHLPGFETVRRSHAAFHRHAGKALAAANSGRRQEAIDMLEAGEYAKTSDQVTVALVELFSQRPQ
jgi:hypothetical protein